MEDECVAGIPFKAELPATVKLESRKLFDDELLLTDDRKFIALTSGLNFGGKGDLVESVDALAQLGHFLRGNHQFEKWNQLSRQVSRLIVCGDSTRENEDSDKV